MRKHTTMQNSKNLTVVILLLIVNLAIIGSLVVVNIIYFEKYDLGVELQNSLIIKHSGQSNIASEFEQVKDDLMADQKFDNLQKNGNWPIQLDGLDKNSTPFE